MNLLSLNDARSGTIQMARNDKPAGQVFKMLADTFYSPLKKKQRAFLLLAEKESLLI